MAQILNTPMLLIEVDERQIRLPDDNLSLPTSSKDVISRLFRLVHDFPTIWYSTMMLIAQADGVLFVFCMLIWSSSPQATSKVFEDLKKQCRARY